MNNSVNLGDIYGLYSCPSGGCDKTTGGMINNIPTLEQIAPQVDNDTISSVGGMSGTNSSQPQTNQMPNTIVLPQHTGSYEDTTSTSIAPTNGVSSSVNIPMTQQQAAQEDAERLERILTYSQPFPVTASSIQYLNSFMRTQIGRRITVQFQIGTQGLTEKNGYLLGVGANFILLNEVGTTNVLSCDFYAIKFVTFYY